MITAFGLLRQVGQAEKTYIERFKREVFEEHGFADQVREAFISGVRSGVNGVRHHPSWVRETLLVTLKDANLVGGS